MEFACKNFNIEEVIRCSLRLTKSDYKILKLLMENSNKKLDTNYIASKLNIDLSTVQRSLKKMNERKLVRRSQINLEKGGYSFIYCICDKEEIRYSVKKIIYNWVDKFNSEIERW
jgi:predicted transcriptional regulator